MSKNKDKSVAIVLAAGQGKRMNSNIQKQYLLLKDKPVLYYSLKIFEESFIDEIILVVGKGEIDYCQTEIVKKYGFCKVTHIVEGGRERYHSVMKGIEAASACGCSILFIHDGARPFLTQDILKRAYDEVRIFGAAVVAMPVKDTIKIADHEDFAVETPDRKTVWLIQTPQVFEYKIIRDAYFELIAAEKKVIADHISITDDAMVLEMFGEHRIKLVEGSYENIKITTPEDLKIANAFLP